MARNWNKHKATDLLSRRRIQIVDVALLVEVGSTMHGIDVPGSDDLDLTAVRFEPWHEFAVYVHDRQSMMVRTQPDGARSSFGDIDINVYTVRKFASLTAKGNPSILAVHFAPNKWHGRHSWVNWSDLLAYATSKQAGNAFKGYMRQQLERWQGKRGQKNVNRPELVEKYGFDTKYAGHAVRLGLQGVEYLQTGRFTLPMIEHEATLIRDIRTGAYTEAEAMNIAVQVERDLVDAFEKSPLPDQPNKGGVDMWVADTYRQHYGDALAVANELTREGQNIGLEY